MQDLHSSPVGQLVPVSGHDPRFNESYEAHAFVPCDLPDTLAMSDTTWHIITEAMTELGRLDTAAAVIPSPDLVARIATRREAIGTSALEGTYADLADLFAAEVLPEEDREGEIPPNVKEVMNYTRASDAAFTWLREGRPLGFSMLSELQAEIIRGTSTDVAGSGAIREIQVFIGVRHRRIGAARFVPPPPGDSLVAACERWIDWINSPTISASIQLIPRIALAHYQFETLHPFIDGNGRLGRLVAVLQMLQDGVIHAPVISLSPWLKHNAEEYRDHLLRISCTGNWDPWVAFIAEAIKNEAISGRKRILALLHFRDEITRLVQENLPQGRLAFEIAQSLIEHPILSVADSTRRHGRTNQANRNAINALVELGVLEHYGPISYARLYLNRRVLSIIGD